MDIIIAGAVVAWLFSGEEQAKPEETKEDTPTPSSNSCHCKCTCNCK